MATPGLSRLRDGVHGAVIGPADERWDRARQAWNLAVDQRPAAVVVAADVDDVTTTVRFAAEAGLQVAPQATGHGAGDSLDGVLLLRTAALQHLHLDTHQRTARVGPGVLWRQLHERSSPHGLCGLVGTGPGLGVTGYTLGGGVGLLARRYGLAAHRVRAAELVTADAAVLQVDPAHHPDLFWALRGGGGTAGVVTALEVDLVATPELVAGQLIWPADAARDVLGTYRRWTQTVPDELTSLATVLAVPPLPHVPEPLRGRTVITLTVCHLGGEAQARALLAPFTDLATPLLDTLGPTTPAGLDIAGIPPDPLPSRLRTELLTDLPDQAIDALLALGPGPGSDSPLILTELRHLGGALARPEPEHGAAGTLDAPFLLEALGPAPTPDRGDAVAAQLDRVRNAVDAWRTGRTLRNFATLGDRDPHRFFDPDTLTRLADITRRYDPDQVIRDPLAPARAGPVRDHPVAGPGRR